MWTHKKKKKYTEAYASSVCWSSPESLSSCRAILQKDKNKKKREMRPTLTMSSPPINSPFT